MSRVRLLNLLNLEKYWVSISVMVGYINFWNDTASHWVEAQRWVRGSPMISSQKWWASSCPQESFVCLTTIHCPSLAINMDEMLLWLNMPGETTITGRGEWSVPLRTTGHEKGRFTVVLSAMANGRKLKPYVVFKGARAKPEMSTTGVIVALSKNGWMKSWRKIGWNKCGALPTLDVGCWCGMFTSATS